MVQQSGPLSHKSGLVSCNFQPSLLSERERERKIFSSLYFTYEGEDAATAPVSPVLRAANSGLTCDRYYRRDWDAMDGCLGGLGSG